MKDSPPSPVGTTDNGADARFEDAPFSDRPLRLRAEGAEDLSILSSLLQDGVGRVTDIAWLRRKRRLVLVLNRFRWEDAEAAKRDGRPFERVRAALVVDDVRTVRTRGIAPGDKAAVIWLLSLAFEEGEDGAGRLMIQGAGETAFAVDVECLSVSLADLTRPWQAQAGQPAHDDAKA
ncbi:MAG: DUF2948 family protein [Pseudomonadota bacterium]